MSLPVRLKKIVPEFRAALERPEIKYDFLEWGGKRMRDSGLSRVWSIHCACDATRAALFATVLCASMNSATLQ